MDVEIVICESDMMDFVLDSSGTFNRVDDIQTNA